MDPKIAAFCPLPLSEGGEIPKHVRSGQSRTAAAAATTTATTKTTTKTTTTAVAATSVAAPPAQETHRRGLDANRSTVTQASTGGASGSTLRRHRKKKLPPSKEKLPDVTEFDASGKRVASKKEHSFRIFEALRFRALSAGDFVAARVTSRDLWILARVQADFPSFAMTPDEFLQLSGARRDAHFREKVAIKDVEEKGSGGTARVSRNLVLPLPRTFSEAAEWGQRCKKDSRVYAMYPHTTSLYSATVIDNVTYCRQDDDIIVVEFDGDEPGTKKLLFFVLYIVFGVAINEDHSSPSFPLFSPADETGVLPKHHIPARFVTLIPREFEASLANNKKRKSLTSAQPSLLPNNASNKRQSLTDGGSGIGGGDDVMDGMVTGMGFDDLNMSADSLEDFGFDFSDM